MTLHFQKFGEANNDASPLVLIHGLFGSGANWRTIAKAFSADRETYVLDLRNHGRSPHLSSHTYLDMAGDIQEFAITQGLEDYVLCGHSMGGKAVMTNALMGSGLELDNRMKAIIVLDIAPVSYLHSASHANNLAALKGLDITNLKSRAEADTLLQETIPEVGVRLFLLQSLTRVDDKFEWRLNLDALDEYMGDIVGFPNQLLVDKQFTKPALFTYGGASDFVEPESHELINNWFPHAKLECIDGAGHWIHIDKRQEMMKSINEFLKEIST